MPRATPEAPELVVQEYLRVLKRWKWVILVVVLGCVGATLGWSLNQPKIYQSQAEVLLQPRSNENLFNALNDIRDPSRLAQTEMKVIESQPVRELVARNLGSAPAIATSQSGVADIIEIQARDVDPMRAAAIANAYADGYIEFRHTRAIDDILAATTQIQAASTACSGRSRLSRPRPHPGARRPQRRPTRSSTPRSPPSPRSGVPSNRSSTSSKSTARSRRAGRRS